MSELIDIYERAANCIRCKDYAEALSYLEYAMSIHPHDKPTQILVEILRLKRLCEDILNDKTNGK